MSRKEPEMKDPKPRIVVGVDGSDESRQALRWAARLAPALGADIEVLAVWQRPGFVTGPLEGVESADRTPEPEGRVWSRTREAVNAAFETGMPANLHILVREGHPAEQLLTRAQKAAMVILGSRGTTGLKGRLQGSVSRYVSEHANCPVVIVHGSDDVNPVG
jgi:nucleotide-binding universal stress UspA family protein